MSPRLVKVSPGVHRISGFGVATQNVRASAGDTLGVHLAPGIANNPLWLWESVAVFEAEEFVAPASVAGIASGNFPRLANIDRGASGVSIYDVGYTIAEYTVERWGYAGLRRLLVAHGDTAVALGVSLEAYEQGWHDFVVERYL